MQPEAALPSCTAPIVVPTLRTPAGPDRAGERPCGSLVKLYLKLAPLNPPRLSPPSGVWVSSKSTMDGTHKVGVPHAQSCSLHSRARRAQASSGRHMSMEKCDHQRFSTQVFAAAVAAPSSSRRHHSLGHNPTRRRASLPCYHGGTGVSRAPRVLKVP